MSKKNPLYLFASQEMSYILREKYYHHVTKFKAKVLNEKPKNSMTPLYHLPAFPENAKQAISCLDPGRTKHKRKEADEARRSESLRWRCESFIDVIQTLEIREQDLQDDILVSFPRAAELSPVQDVFLRPQLSEAQDQPETMH